MFAVVPLELREPGTRRAIPAANAALIVANVLMFWLGWSFYWHDWRLSYLGHLLGMLCGVAVVLLLPTRISMRRRSAADSL